MVGGWLVERERVGVGSCVAMHVTREEACWHVHVCDMSVCIIVAVLQSAWACSAQQQSG